MGTEPGTADRFGGLESAVRRERTRTCGGTLYNAYLPDQLCGALDAAGRAATDSGLKIEPARVTVAQGLQRAKKSEGGRFLAGPKGLADRPHRIQGSVDAPLAAE